MAKSLSELRERLLRAGVAPRHVRRYLAELGDHFSDLIAEEMGAGRSRPEAESAALVRLGAMDELAQAMIEQREFQSLSSQAPWAAFGLVPLCVLGAAWFVACFILWSGWRMFLPGAETPFGTHPVSGFANMYFQLGRAIYFGAPLIVGWGIGWVAARQRLKAVWPSVGFLLIALAGGTLQVHASRPHLPGAEVHVGMGFASGPAIQVISSGLAHASVFFCLTVTPYLLWRLQKAASHLS